MEHTAFSASARAEHWSALSEGVYDLVVVGGGITGAGVAFDAAGRGLRVCLVEAGDIGQGTSSRSSRLIHGGLRYLETFDFGLVFEALRERRRLLELAPHLVSPLTFLFPVFRGDPTPLPVLSAGVLLYETLALFRSPGRPRFLRRSDILSQNPTVRAEGLRGGALYHDAQVDDARLTLAVARAAHETGARTVSYAEAVGFELQPGQVGRVLVRDRLSGAETTIRARLVLNATGPWSDALRRIVDPTAAPRLRTTSGAHILVEGERLPNRQAMIFRSPVDGRVMFMLPWGAFTYVGTTDTEYAGDPGDAVADAADVEYLLASANALFPEAHLVSDDVVSTWSGIRPLLRGDEAGLSESATSREHAIWRDASGLLNVAGGKLTTYRSMAAEVTQVAADVLEREFGVATHPFFTEYVPLPGAPEDAADLERLAGIARAAGLGAETAAAIARRHGSETLTIAALIEADPSLAGALLPGTTAIRAEVVHAVRSELAMTVEDVLRRRLQLFYESRDGAMPAARETALLMAPLDGVGWGEAEVDRQVAGYAAAVAATRGPRAGPPSSSEGHEQPE